MFVDYHENEKERIKMEVNLLRSYKEMRNKNICNEIVLC